MGIEEMKHVQVLMKEKYREYADKYPVSHGGVNLAAVIASEEPLRTFRGVDNFPKPVIEMTPEEVLAWKPKVWGCENMVELSE